VPPLPDPSPAPLLPGTGGRTYTLVGLLGRGGFGEVYRALERRRGGGERVVAVKILHAHTSSDAEAAKRLRDEAKLLARLDHAGVARLLDRFRIAGRDVLVQEYAEGADLAALLHAGRLPVGPACGLLGAVAAALHAARIQPDPVSGRPLGLVHRDVKPANIRVSPAGHVRLLDFGVARAEFAGREAQTVGMAIGTLGFMAPEALEGHVSGATDVYALGIVAWIALTARPVPKFSLDPAKQVRQVADAAEDIARLRAGEAPAGLPGFVARMLAYRAEERPTAAEVAAQMAAFSAEAPGPDLAAWAADAVPIAATAEGAVAEGDTAWLAAVRAPPEDDFDLGDSLEEVLPVVSPTPQAPPVEPAAARWPWIGVALAAAALAAAGGALVFALGAPEPTLSAAVPTVPARPAVSPPVLEVAPPAEPRAAQADPAPGPKVPPRVSPAPAAPQPMSTSASAPPPATPQAGRVEVHGDVLSATLISTHEEHLQPGEVPPGRYDLQVRRANGETRVYLGLARVVAAQTLRCEITAEDAVCR